MRCTISRSCTLLCAVGLSVFTSALLAQAAPAAKNSASKASVPQALPPVIKDLPVRKVVLYKNGVGYFEHAGSVSGNQRVAIDFTSSQLNDVLQSLTVLDQGGGRIAGVNYNSTMPLEEQLKTLSLGLKDYPSTIAIYHALRGQRLEVTGAGAPLVGRLVNVEFRKETDKNGLTSDDHYFLIVATDTGALRTAELTDAVSVRMADPALQKQFNAYLEILAAGQNQQGRHLILDALGQGQRELRVSYISEVPVWKSTYRMVFPRVPNSQATVQGWAVVDNTVGADWDHVQLSLVAGAPQSFIQPLSQPIYTHRPEIPIATQAQFSPQTHEAAEAQNYVVHAPSEMLNNQLIAPTRIPSSIRMTSEKKAEAPTGFGVAGMEGLEGVSPAAMGSMFANGANVATGAGYGAGVGGGVYRASDAIHENDVATNSFDDFFEYALTQPVTIHKNESAMVPILQQDLPAEHVTLWSERERQPLRAVWLENKSKLTLDSGSFSIFEGGEFAGEGLLDPIHPSERRLLSYAVDQAMRVKVTGRENQRILHHVEIHKGAVVETHMDVASVTYTAVNSADMDRVVLLEHPRRGNGWSLSDGVKAAETAPNLYRFKLPVAAHSTEKLDVREQGPEKTSVALTSDSDQREYLLDLVKRVPEAQEKLKPLVEAQGAIADLDTKLAEVAEKGKTAAADEARDRENLTALKGNDAARRFVDELNRAEDQLQEARKQTADLEMQKQAAVDKLDALIGGLDWAWDVK
jgi:hypothetical protein